MVREPSPPGKAPSYAVSPLQRQDPETLRELAEYCHALAEYKEHKAFEEIEKEEVPDEAQEELKQSSGPVQVLEKVKCGDETCHCMKGGEKHGPYLYEYERKGDKIVSRYVGKPEVTA